MNFRYLKPLFAAVLVSALPLAVQAEEASKPTESFQTICLGSWMKRVNDVKDPAGYKNFGEKYCDCAQSQPLDNDAAVNKAIQVCMSRTLLHDAMDTLEGKVGLDKASESDVVQICQDKWNLVFPQLADNVKQSTNAYCECSKPKLAEMLKKSDDMTDKEYYGQIDNIAAACASNINPTSGPASTTAGTKF